MRRSAPPFEFAPALYPINLPPSRCSVPFEKSVKRILIMRLGAHGDLLMGTPLLSALRAAYPDAWITWIVEHDTREAIDAHPSVDDVLLWNGRAWKQPLRLGLLPIWLWWALRLNAELMARRYDVFISFQPEEWPLLTRAVRADMTIGIFDTFRQFNGDESTSKHTRLYRRAYAHPDLPEHRTDQYLLPLRALGLAEPTEKSMSIGWTQADEKCVARYLEARGVIAHERVIIIVPRTTWRSRCWDGARYAELGDALRQETDVRMVLIGSRSERAEVEEVARTFKDAPIVAAGVLTFRQVAALTARAALLISGDTGPMHLAAAVGTPYLALFGPTPVRGRVPLAGRGIALAQSVPCGPCDQKACPNPAETHMLCMRLLTVNEVFMAAKNFLTGATLSA